jgi:hypothetical protein
MGGEFSRTRRKDRHHARRQRLRHRHRTHDFQQASRLADRRDALRRDLDLAGVRTQLHALLQQRHAGPRAADAAPLEPRRHRPRSATLTNGETFGYKPGRKKWRLGIFEPNICMVKTSHLPMLLVDVAHRANPRMIELLRVYNTFHMKDHVTFVGFANSLDIVRHGLATFEGRFPVYQCLSSQVDAVVCHQWENGQNYLYYEALHGGYPLIHNSTFIDDCGYFYPGFDCEEGGLALMQAFAQHDADLANYRARPDFPAHPLRKTKTTSVPTMKRWSICTTQAHHDFLPSRHLHAMCLACVRCWRPAGSLRTGPQRPCAGVAAAPAAAATGCPRARRSAGHADGCRHQRGRQALPARHFPPVVPDRQRQHRQ